MPYDDDGRWTMPDWMEPFRDRVEAGAGGNTAESLMTRLEQESNLGTTNAIVLALALQVQAKVSLLYSLARDGLLAGVDPGDLR